jgi:hypothetical protein
MGYVFIPQKPKKSTLSNGSEGTEFSNLLRSAKITSTNLLMAT